MEEKGIVIEARVEGQVVYAYESSGNVFFSSPEGRSPQMPEVLEHLGGATKWLNGVLSRPKAEIQRGS